MREDIKKLLELTVSKDISWEAFSAGEFFERSAVFGDRQYVIAGPFEEDDTGRSFFQLFHLPYGQLEGSDLQDIFEEEALAAFRELRHVILAREFQAWEQARLSFACQAVAPGLACREGGGVSSVCCNC